MKSAASNKETVAELECGGLHDSSHSRVCVCVLKGYHLTFDYLAEHSLT